MKLVALLFCFYVILQLGDASEGSFKWSSSSYSLKAILTVPAANISEPYQVWVDGETGKSRVDFYDGMDKLYRECKEETNDCKYYKIHPRTNNNMVTKEVCNEVDSRTTEVKMYALNTYLPIKHWTYVGLEKVNNVETRKFIYKYSVKLQEKINATVVYTVWVNIKQPAGTATPVRFLYELKCDEKLLDNFRHDYIFYDDTKPDEAIIQKPPGMSCSLLHGPSHEPVDPLAEYINPDLVYSRVENAFDRFKIKHNKRYSNKDEHFRRLNIFKNNLRYINSFNRQHRSFSVGVNHMADLSKDEIMGLLGTITNKNDNIEHEGSGNDNDDSEDDVERLEGVHSNFDWRDYGGVTPVKDQTSICGSCYAFTTAAAVESSAYISRGCKNLDEVSEQAIIDCSWGTEDIGNLGCTGGTYEYALEWVKRHGIPLKAEYGPYLAMEGLCHIWEMNKLIWIADFYQVDKKKQVIKETLRKNGPLLASIDASPLSFTFYTSGVYEGPECSNSPDNRNHGVNVVGYGKDSGKEYWIIKNSFGKDWGENGYMRLGTERNRCGLKNYVYTVTFKKNKSTLCKPLK